MFDIGGLELFLILIIALLVIGPERMPEVARSIGRFIGKTRRFIQSVKEESELRETVEELRRELDLKEEAATLRNLEQDLRNDLYGNLNDVRDELEKELDLSELQRPTFGSKEPRPLHLEHQTPIPTEPPGPKQTAPAPEGTARDSASAVPQTATPAPSHPEKPVADPASAADRTTSRS